MPRIDELAPGDLRTLAACALHCSAAVRSMTQGALVGGVDGGDQPVQGVVGRGRKGVNQQGRYGQGSASNVCGVAALLRQDAARAVERAVRNVRCEGSMRHGPCVQSFAMVRPSLYWRSKIVVTRYPSCIVDFGRSAPKSCHASWGYRCILAPPICTVPPSTSAESVKPKWHCGRGRLNLTTTHAAPTIAHTRGSDTVAA